jgi:cytokinin dehydrogenase
MNTSRRDWLLSSISGALVVAFDPVRRCFLSVASAQAPATEAVPRLDGQLVFDAAALQEAATDFGGIASHAPWAVLRPASARDISAIVRFARRHRLHVAMRGQAHSVFGQAQAEAGVVIDSRSLATIHELGPNEALVDTGVTWRQLLTAALDVGLTPPVLTDYLDLSIGGVLSVGGMGGASNLHGFVVDTCTELTVVTGEGELVHCSQTRHTGLFRAVLGGLGQCGIIVQARIELAPARPLARLHQLTYTDLSAFLEDQRQACLDERFDFLQGLVSPQPDGGLAYVLQGARWYAPDAPPSDDTAVAGLSPANVSVQDVPYPAWVARVDSFVEQWKAAGVWTTPHPWSDLFLPDESVQDFAQHALAGLTPNDLGLGVILLYPMQRARSTRPLMRLPSSEIVWLFDILRVPLPGATDIGNLLAQNRALLDRAVAAGGTRYPISAVALDTADFVRHYGPAWPYFRAAKAFWDPDHVLTPGQGIFRG